MDTDTTSSENELDAIVKFSSMDKKLCVICNKTSSTPLTTATEKSSLSFLKSCEAREIITKAVDKNILNAIEDIKNGFLQNVLWHKSCYLSYVSKKNIHLLQQRLKKMKEYKQAGIKPPPPVGRTLRKDFDINKCVICQKRSFTKRLSQVMSKNIEMKIQSISNINSEVRKRIGANDLIAMEIKYHTSCLLTEQKKLQKQSSSQIAENIETQCKTKYEEAFQIVKSEVQDGIAKGKAYTVTSIYERYVEVGGIKSKRFLMDILRKELGTCIEIIKSKKANESAIVMPFITKSETIHNYIEATTSSSANDASLSIGTSQLSEIHKVCVDIGAEIDKISKDIQYKDLNVSNYKQHIPKSLMWLISLLVSNESEACDDVGILSVCQDIIYNRSKGKTLTPKHIGLGVMIHQETRSKKIVEALHHCGHCISYKDVLRLRNTIAHEEIAKYINNDNCFIPRQLIPDRFLQFAADNIDILEETLDKSPTFHGTQIVAFQRGPPNDAISKEVKILPYRKKLEIPANLHMLHTVNYNKSNKPTPQLVHKDNILALNHSEEVNKFMLSYNLAWAVCRTSAANDCIVPQWSGMGKILHKDEKCVTTYGLLPLLPYVASEYDTVWTTMKQCSEIAKQLNISHTVMTFDQAIYFRAKEIQWLKPVECENFIICLGGFHIMLNFLKVIGQHMEKSGLGDVWIESGLYGDSTVAGIFNGKKWNKGIRAHKLTYESLLRILLPMFEQWLLECNNGLIDTVNICRSKADEICQLISTQNISQQFFYLVKNIQQLSDTLVEFISGHSPTFRVWCTYLEMVETLLEFLYSERTSNWQLHLSSFRKMTPWFFAYDHNNYARWGPVYLHDMLELPLKAPEVHKEFSEGNFVVKRLNGAFNNISVDQALEHVNKTSKAAGGIVGLTKNSTRLDEWYLSYNEIGSVIENFLSSLKMNHDYDYSKNIEVGKHRIAVDEEAVLNLHAQFLRYEVFTTQSDCLISISTKDICSTQLTEARLNAREKGEDALKSFVNIMDTPHFYKPLKKMNVSSTIKRKSEKPTSQSQMLQGQQFLQRVLAAKELGRDVDYNEIFKYELTPFPMSLTVNGKLSTPANKSALGHILENYCSGKFNTLPNSDNELCHIIDGMTLVQSIGKPSKCTYFGEYGNMFSNIVFKNSYNATRIDVVFDYYKDDSIKNTTRQKRGSGSTIDKVIENSHVPIPKQWHLFIHSIFNKRQLTNFLSEQIINSSVEKHVKFVTSGGFNNLTDYKTNVPLDDGDILAADHEEADTRILLHILSAKRSGYTRCLVDCNDTDILVLLAHFHKHLTPELWFKAGRGDTVRYIPVHGITLDQHLLKNLPAFHALTGCDTTSQLVGFGKKTCWKTYLDYHTYLDGVGTDDFNEGMFKKMHAFIIKLYARNTSINCINALRGAMAASTPIAKLPPTTDSLKQHCLRSYFQAFVWLNSLHSLQHLPNVTDFGWTIDQTGTISPVLCTLPPFPDKLHVLTSCGCKKNCASKICACRKSRIGCVGSCTCMAQKTCKNPHTTPTTIMPPPSCSESSEEDQ